VAAVAPEAPVKLGVAVRDQQPGITRAEVQHIANLAVPEVYAIDEVGEFS
jgi:hypothetical protein